ncbi:HDOD domain-containing protein [Pseudomonas cavernicola]|uniref:HDOD domain-containing protein n=1 Tax=Pseudomonas cavernicola TaxID=2320866 RepID=A0A418XIX9_9PSED|nr:HDOD domain-containing protein [Pseudomonas cavernicola]RJG12424.1 HDOD domain-containing protein [Pseudomonas cavernicola]
MDAEQTGYARYRQVVSQLMCGDEQLPSLPVITLEIRRSLRSPEVSLGTLSGLISKDPALSALLMKYAASAMLRSSRPPKTLQDVLQVLGLAQVDRVTMIHSIKSLFTLHSPGHKKLFIEAWERLILKASTCAFLARLVGYTQPDHAFLASLLSELGSLAVLSAFRDDPVAPSRELYYRLCRDYSKSLGVILLKKWAVDEEFIGIIRNTGNWLHRERYHLELIDLVNLSLYHSVKGMNAEADLPELSSLAAYAKLLPPLNVIGDNDELALLISHRAEIHALADALR